MSRVTTNVLRPLRQFLATEAASGLLLIGGAVIALVWANSPAADSYHRLWETAAGIQIGSFDLTLSLRDWVNDGLMTLFFFVVGLEIKRELVQGELRHGKRAALPLAGAVGGMIVPALLFTAVNLGSATVRGWGVPMATDIAMAVSALALVRAGKVPASLSLFLLALAIVDDIGAILVVAVFYSAGIKVLWLIGAAAAIGVSIVARQRRVLMMSIHVACGVALWFCLHEAGVHSTLAGVAMGLLTPTTPMIPTGEYDEAELLDVSTVHAARTTQTIARHSISEVERLEETLHPWTSYLIVPLFALANAGIELTSSTLADLPSSRPAVGVVLGLVIGKPLGILVAAALAVRMGWAELPHGVSWRQLAGVGMVAGIGFTVSIFIAGLAFDDSAALDAAKLGVLIASVISGIIGVLWLRQAPTNDSVSDR